MKCQHPSFNVKAEVYRLTDVDDGPPTGFSAEIKANCMECNMPFQWLGLQRGLSTLEPMVSPDGLQLRAPITPLEEL